MNWLSLRWYRETIIVIAVFIFLLTSQSVESNCKRFKQQKLTFSFNNLNLLRLAFSFAFSLLIALNTAPTSWGIFFTFRPVYFSFLNFTLNKRVPLSELINNYELFRTTKSSFNLFSRILGLRLHQCHKCLKFL